MAKLHYQVLHGENVEKAVNVQKTSDKTDVVRKPETKKNSSNKRQSTGSVTFYYDNKSYMSEIGEKQSNDLERKIDIILVNNDTVLRTKKAMVILISMQANFKNIM
ncbi:hypothetical protein ACJMK2_001584 [Sinanodonta woodiana]|uniref:Uncharacterized protein n=1 Tax=Sinanodonta woodiana TaxID=1069815 RepID=A0ABD3XVW1_SINWO